jgi:hypothetical protein
LVVILKPVKPHHEGKLTQCLHALGIMLASFLVVLDDDLLIALVGIARAVILGKKSIFGQHHRLVAELMQASKLYFHALYVLLIHVEGENITVLSGDFNHRGWVARGHPATQVKMIG